MSDQWLKMKALLENEYTWPANYKFKFIIPKDKENEVEALFPNEKITYKASKKGNYLSITFEKTCEDSEDIIKIYERASTVKGLILL